MPPSATSSVGRCPVPRAHAPSPGGTNRAVIDGAGWLGPDGPGRAGPDLAELDWTELDHAERASTNSRSAGSSRRAWDRPMRWAAASRERSRVLLSTG